MSFKNGKLVCPRPLPKVICRQNNMHTDDPITKQTWKQEDSRSVRAAKSWRITPQHTNTRTKKENKDAKTKTKQGGEDQACDWKTVKAGERARRTDRQRDRWTERMGALSFSFTPYRMNRASVLLLCSNTPHGCLLPATTMHRYTHTHTAACLTVGTITLLRGIDRGLKEKVTRMRSRKRLTTHTHTHTASRTTTTHKHTHKHTAVQLSCQLDSLGWIHSLLSLIHHSSVRSGRRTNIHMPS